MNPDLRRLKQLLQLPSEERESSEVVASIRTLIARDAEARSFYVFWSYFELNLEWVLAGNLLGHSEVLVQLQQSRRSQRRIRLWGGTACVATTLILLSLVTCWFYERSVNSLAIAPVVGTVELPTMDSGPAGQEPPIRIVRQGAQISFAEGTVLKLVSGAALASSGRLKLDLIDSNSVYLHEGEICADVPPAASGFTVQTVSGSVRDVGTLFGLRVSPRGSDVQVLSGLVVAQPRAQEPQNLRGGVAVDFESNGRLGPFRRANAALFASQLRSLAASSATARELSEKIEQWASSDPLRKIAGELHRWDPPPGSVAQGDRITPGYVGVFREGKSVALASPLSLYAAVPGTYAPDRSPELTRTPELATPTVFFLHCQSLHNAVLRGQLTFDQPVIGFLLTQSQLDPTDDRLRGPAVPKTYPSGVPELQARGFLVDGLPGDRLTISSDRKTIDFVLDARSQRLSQWRILVDDPPPL